MSEQQQKPTRRTARDAGLSTSGSRSKAPVAAAIVIVLALVGAGIGGFQLSRGSNGQDQQQPVAEQTASEDANKTAQDAEKDADKAKESEEDKSKDDAKAKEDSKSSDDKSVQERATVKDASSNGSGSGSKSTSNSSTGASTSSASGTGAAAAASSSSSSASSGSSTKSSSNSSSSGSSANSAYTSAKSKLKGYYDNLMTQSSRLKSFVDGTYNPHLYGSLDVHKKDYESFKLLKSQILGAISSSGGWAVTSMSAPGDLIHPQFNLINASDILKKRLDIIEAGYVALCGLPADASNAKIDDVNGKACSNSGPMYQEFHRVMGITKGQVS